MAAKKNETPAPTPAAVPDSMTAAAVIGYWGVTLEGTRVRLKRVSVAVAEDEASGLVFCNLPSPGGAVDLTLTTREAPARPGKPPMAFTDVVVLTAHARRPRPTA